MKTIVLYDTKYGFTEKCARYLYEKLEESDIRKLNDDYNINDYDRIFLGTYIDDGEVSAKTRDFLKQHKSKLLNKKLGIFCSALDKNDYLNALQKSLDPEIFYNSKIVLPGGKVNLEELSFLEKRRIRKRINVVENTEEFHPYKLDELLKLLEI